MPIPIAGERGVVLRLHFDQKISEGTLQEYTRALLESEISAIIPVIFVR